MQDMESFLSFEVKKELADRYFGSRKLIEDDCQQYGQNIQDAFRLLECTVGFDLIRLYILLRQESLIHDFFRLTGLRDDLFLDPYVLSSATIRKRLFAGLSFRGLTRHARFQHCFLDTYERLADSTEAYRAVFKQLADEQQTIVQEIELFQRKNDLSAMMGFLRTLGGNTRGDGVLAGTVNPAQDHSLEEKMKILPPKTAEALLPNLPDLPPLKRCKGKLIDLIDSAYRQQGSPEIRDFSR